VDRRPLRASGGQLVDGAVLLAWIVLSAGEFRHCTSVTTFLGQPRRLRVVSAKLAAAAPLRKCCGPPRRHSGRHPGYPPRPGVHFPAAFTCTSTA